MKDCPIEKKQKMDDDLGCFLYMKNDLFKTNEKRLNN